MSVQLRNQRDSIVLERVIRERIANAIADYRARHCTSIRATAAAWTVSEATLRLRLRGRTSRSHAHEREQILSSAEEGILVRWLSRLTIAGFPASPAPSQVSCARADPSSRHPEIQGEWRSPKRLTVQWWPPIGVVNRGIQI